MPRFNWGLAIGEYGNGTARTPARMPIVTVIVANIVEEEAEAESFERLSPALALEY